MSIGSCLSNFLEHFNVVEVRGEREGFEGFFFFFSTLINTLLLGHLGLGSIK